MSFFPSWRPIPIPAYLIFYWNKSKQKASYCSSCTQFEHCLLKSASTIKMIKREYWIKFFKNSQILKSWNFITEKDAASSQQGICNNPARPGSGRTEKKLPTVKRKDQTHCTCNKGENYDIMNWQWLFKYVWYFFVWLRCALIKYFLTLFLYLARTDILIGSKTLLLLKVVAHLIFSKLTT